MKNTITLVVLSLLPSMVYTQEKDIDLQLEKCLNTNISNSEKRKCIEVAEASWDKLLNKYYGLLIDKLPRESQNKLRESQRNWIKYRDTEFHFINEYFLNYKQGSQYYLIGDNKRLELVKKRTLELKEYYDYFDK